MKAVLLSALIYPGAGHFFLKKQTACMFFVVLFSVPLFMVISSVVEITAGLVAQIENGEIPLDIPIITESISNVIANDAALNINIYVMIVVWVIATLDAYRLSKINLQ